MPRHPGLLPSFLLGCALAASGATAPGLHHDLGPWAVTVRPDGGLRVTHGGRELASTPAAPFLEERRFRAYGVSVAGSYRFLVRDSGAFGYDALRGATTEGDALVLRYGATDAPGATATLRVRRAGARLRVEVERRGAAGRGAVLRFRKGAGDRFLGLGEQFARVDHTGHRVPLWVSEQGIGREGAADPPPGQDHGRAALPRWARGRAALRAPWTGRATDTYYPVGTWIDPARGVGFLLDADQRSVLDLGAEDPARWSVEVWEPARFAFELAPGPTPLEVVEQLSASMGRPRLPPPWAFGTWLAVEGGQEVVREAVARAEAFDWELDAIWSQDWVGRRNRPVLQNLRYEWRVDRATYPDLEGLIEELHARDLRFLGYINCFTDPFFDMHREAAQAGHLVGRPWWPSRAFLMWHSTFSVAMVDFTEGAARSWFQGWMERMLDLGMDGWMADYGEWLPWAGRLGEGSAPAVHNRYPALYHEAVAEVLDRRRPDGDFAMLTRSGYTGAQRHQQIVWAGDQEASWDADDGLASLPRAGISAGLSGIPFWTHDVGGYSGGPRTKALLLRWAELGAFSPVFRTHQGLLKSRNWQWDSDDETTALLARWSRIHGAVARRVLLPLARRAAETGRPLVRHLALHYPEDPRVYAVEDQYLLGPHLLVAPVLEEGATARRVVFPAGTWTRVWDDAAFEGPSEAVVDAPVGQPPVFVKGSPERLFGEDRALLRPPHANSP